jgi:hypothetical protein
MTKGELAKVARAGPRSLLAKRAQGALYRRGCRVSLRELGRRTVSECIDACGWAEKVRPLSVRPAWLGDLVAENKAHLRPGVCANCAAREAAVWVDERRTLCIACAPFDPEIADGMRLKGPMP